MKNIKLILLIMAIGTSISSCKKFLEIDAPRNGFVQKAIFEKDETAISAVLGMYKQMASSGYASGDVNSIAIMAGLAADEYKGYTSILKEFNENQLSQENAALNSAWGSLYLRIYAANSILEGLSGENSISSPVKAQLIGETCFIRAFSYFYLVNLFGAVPLHLSTDYEINSKARRSPVKKIYQQVIADLKRSEALLTDDYMNTERVRANKAAAQALLARTYLYLQDWENAEIYAANVIAKTSQYGLVDLESVFLKNSREAIWQLMPNAGSNTPDGGLLILTATPVSVSLNADFALNAFDANDKRKASWLRNYTNTTGTYYYPFKYKVKSSATVSEYSMVLRFAEQYLIRAEARAHLNNIAGSVEDIDKIRNRAGAALIKNTRPEIGKEELLIIIQKERSTELFSEWGHRWFDLKRTGQAENVLGPIKTEWQTTDLLFPIPQTETSRNLNIIQNDGY